MAQKKGINWLVAISICTFLPMVVNLVVLAIYLVENRLDALSVIFSPIIANLS